jgi:hypothetical protein
MGTVRDIEDFKRRHRASPVHQGDLEDFAAWQRIPGRCPGCNARRSLLVAFHDDDTGRPPRPFTRTLPHYRCDGKRISRQEVPLETLKAFGENT